MDITKEQKRIAKEKEKLGLVDGKTWEQRKGNFSVAPRERKIKRNIFAEVTKVHDLDDRCLPLWDNEGAHPLSCNKDGNLLIPAQIKCGLKGFICVHANGHKHFAPIRGMESNEALLAKINYDQKIHKVEIPKTEVVLNA